MNTSYSHGTGAQEGNRYFPHIDGLRALAIIPVVIYHLFPWMCPGGYAGVDVFFVISGYLITSGIIADLKAKRYSITDFYVRRIKRIFPAYVVVIGFVLITAPSFFTVYESKSIATSALYSIGYSANLYFYENVGYFALSARKNPLLHLWSLGVEEQFYLLVPICLWFIWSLRNSLFRLSLSLLWAVSFTISVLAIYWGHTQFAFLMLPSRAWELLAGAILSQLNPISNRAFNEIKWSGVLGFGGLSLILVTYYSLNDGSSFPGLNALPCVLGTALVLRYGQVGIVKAALSFSPMVFIGKISYSLYLWHWPIFTILNSGFSWKRAIIGIFVTFIATYLSWRFIETPVRQWKSLKPKQAFAMLSVGSLTLGCVCLFLGQVENRNGELPRTWHGVDTWIALEQKPATSITSCSLEALNDEKPEVLIKIGSAVDKPSFLVWGDSHALALLPGIDVVAAERRRAGFYLNLKQSLSLDEPEVDREPVMLWLESRPDITDVILVNCWFLHLTNRSNIEEVVAICERLNRAGKHVFLLQSVPTVNLDGLRRLSWGFSVSEQSLSLDEQSYNAMVTRIGEDLLLRELTAKNIATILPVNKAFWDGSYKVGASTQSYFSDNNHLNRIGAIKAMNYLAPLIWDPAKDLQKVR